MQGVFFFLFFFVCAFFFLNLPTFTPPQVSEDTTKKRIHSLSMELMEARNKVDTKDKVGYIYILAGHVMFVCSLGKELYIYLFN